MSGKPDYDRGDIVRPIWGTPSEKIPMDKSFIVAEILFRPDYICSDDYCKTDFCVRITGLPHPHHNTKADTEWCSCQWRKLDPATDLPAHQTTTTPQLAHT